MDLEQMEVQNAQSPMIENEGKRFGLFWRGWIQRCVKIRQRNRHVYDIEFKFFYIYTHAQSKNKMFPLSIFVFDTQAEALWLEEIFALKSSPMQKLSKRVSIFTEQRNKNRRVLLVRSSELKQFIASDHGV